MTETNPGYIAPDDIHFEPMFERAAWKIAMLLGFAMAMVAVV